MSSGDNDEEEVTPASSGPITYRETLPFGSPPPTLDPATLYQPDTQPFAFAPSFHPVGDTGSFHQARVDHADRRGRSCARSGTLADSEPAGRHLSPARSKASSLRVFTAPRAH